MQHLSLLLATSDYCRISRLCFTIGCLQLSVSYRYLTFSVLCHVPIIELRGPQPLGRGQLPTINTCPYRFQWENYMLRFHLPLKDGDYGHAHSTGFSSDAPSGIRLPTVSRELPSSGSWGTSLGFKPQHEVIGVRVTMECQGDNSLLVSFPACSIPSCSWLLPRYSDNQ